MELHPKLSSSKISGSGKICILAHGSCGSEMGWTFFDEASGEKTDYGSLLERDFGFAPLYLRYNSGLHISTNGKRLSALLEKLIASSPTKIREVVLVGHSMGGLLFRSACHYGQKENRKWIRLVSKVFYLGSPHLGTHWEKLGKLTTTVLNTIPTPVTRLISTLGELRSAGVKDLRHGYVTDEDWRRKNANDLFYRHRNRTPLLETAGHYLICGTLSKVPGSKIGSLLGDGLVPTASGTGQGYFPSSAIPFRKEHCRILLGISHYRLQKSLRVYEQMKQWCAAM